MRAQPAASHYIDGQPVENEDGRAFESVYPATGEVIARLHAATPALLDRAVAAARRAQKDWARRPGVERGRVLRRAADIIRERNRELSEIETLDTGKAMQETLAVDPTSAADALEYFGGIAASITGEMVDLGGAFGYTRREPLGVCGGIGAWNYPMQIAAWKGAPALACGNAFVFKPSETTPLTALKLAEILTEAGAPDGLYNVVQGFGDIGAALCTHPGINKVSITGSVPTGIKVMQAAAESLKPVTLELGGKSPLLIFEDADLDSAVAGVLLGNFYSTGQVCSNGTRVFVQRGVKEAFLEKLAERTAAIRLGDPLDEATHLGPLVSKAQLEKVLGMIEAGRKEGARLVAGGGPASVAGFEGGFWVQPTIFADVTDDMTIAREEIFGPVVSILDFDDEAEVIERANNHETGLAAGVFTQNLARGHRVVAELDAGTCWINTYNLAPVELPFGGVKMSGIGRENSKAAIEHYTRIKSVYVELNPTESPY